MAKPKFSYYERVQVVDNFFIGRTGIILDYVECKYFFRTYFNYKVEINSGQFSSIYIEEEDLISLDKIKEEFNNKLESIIK